MSTKVGKLHATFSIKNSFDNDDIGCINKENEFLDPESNNEKV